MKLAKLLTTDHVILEMCSTEHLPAVEELVDHLVAVGSLPAAQRDDILAALKAREDQVSTGIGSGVAIPHAFSDELEEVVAVFGRSTAGIDFEAIDNALVHFIILFIVPRKQYQVHLRTLASIAKLFTNCSVREQFSQARNREEILAIFDHRRASGE